MGGGGETGRRYLGGGGVRVVVAAVARARLGDAGGGRARERKARGGDAMRCDDASGGRGEMEQRDAEVWGRSGEGRGGAITGFVRGLQRKRHFSFRHPWLGRVSREMPNCLFGF